MQKIKKEIFPYLHDESKDINNYFLLYFEKVWPFCNEYWFTETLKFLLTKDLKFLLTPEELKEVAKEASEYTRIGNKGINIYDFQTGFLARKLKSKYGSFEKEDFSKIEREIYKGNLEGAPDYIKNANYKTSDDEEDVKAKYELWEMEESEDVKKIAAKEGLKPRIYKWEEEVAKIKKYLEKDRFLKEFNSLTPEQTGKETTKYLKNLCSQFNLSEKEKHFLENEFEKWVSEFLKGCKVGKYLSYALYKIAQTQNWQADFLYLSKLQSNI